MQPEKAGQTLATFSVGKATPELLLRAYSDVRMEVQLLWNQENIFKDYALNFW